MTTMDQLSAVGFSCVGGQIDRDGVNYGILTGDGPVLTPDGDEIYKTLTRKTRKARDEDTAAAVAAAIAGITPTS